jgi:adenylate cyclase
LTEGERKLAAIMFTDMVGYTALGQRNESLSLTLVEEQRKLIRPILNRHDGREIKTIGDGFLVEFANALEAVRCAYDIQRATREFNIALPEDKRIHLRVGLHLGDVVESKGDISGDAVNVASRIEPLAEDGGVCLTRQVFDQVEGKFELILASIGQRDLKNVKAPVDVYKVVMPWENEGTFVPLELDRNRVAVLPFANMSQDPNDTYFADGMVEELISTLSNIAELSVISRTSSSKFKDGGRTVLEIGKELRAGTILEGSVRKAGNRARISVQLIEVQNDRHLWGETYERDVQDVFQIQTDIARRIASTLKVKLLGGMQQIEKRATANPEAYIHYLRGRYEHGFLERTPEDWRKAISHFERAIQIDPGYSLAYAGLADCYENLGQDFKDPREVYQKARELAEKAIGLNSSLPQAHLSLAVLLYRYYWDRPKSEMEFRKSIELNPNSAEARRTYSDFLLTDLRVDESLAELNRSIELDPLSLENMIERGRLFSLTGRYDQAIAECDRALNIDGTKLSAYEWIAIAYAGKSLFEEALHASNELLPLYNGTIAKMIQARIYSILNEPEKVLRILNELTEASARGYVSPVVLAVIHKLAGNEDKAFEMLESAYQNHSPHLIYLKSHQFYFGVFRSDSRILSLLGKVGLST